MKEISKEIQRYFPFLKNEIKYKELALKKHAFYSLTVILDL